MKLLEMWTRDNVHDDSNTPTRHFHERHGHVMHLEQGIVTVTGKGMAASRLVPLSNVAFMTPAPAEKKKP